MSTKLSKGEFDLPIPVSIWFPLSLILPQKLFSDQLLLSYNQLLSVAALTYWQKPKHLLIPDHLLLPYNNLLSFVTLTDESQSTWYFQLTFTLYMHYMRRFMGFGTICTILKTWETPMEECYLVKLKASTILKITLFHGCCWRFSNCTNGTKSRKQSHIQKT